MPNVVSAPAAVMTFLIADIRGYTRFTLERGDQAAAELSDQFAQIAGGVIRGHEGRVLGQRGDEIVAAFASAREALRAALDLQAAVPTSDGVPGFPGVGVGLDSGEAVAIGDDYRGTALNLAARLCSLAGPGEVLASETVTNLARKLEGLHYVDRGATQLKGFTEPITVYRIEPAPPDLPGELPETSVREGKSALKLQELSIGGFLGSLPDRNLVGREKELKQALTLLDAVEAGNGRLILISGEPGVGKTRLAQEITLSLRNRGFTLGAGTCQEARQATPYYPFIPMLTALHRSATPDIIKQIPERWSYLANLLPGEGYSSRTGSAGEEDLQRLFWAVSGFLQALSKTSSVALLLDDLQWADGASIELFDHLARETRGNPILILGTYRDTEVGRQHPLEAALREILRQRLAERIAVRRLDDEATRELIAAEMNQVDVSQDFARLMYDRTEGNPFFVDQLLRVLIERGDVYQEDGRWERRDIEEIDVPESIRSVIGQRLDLLSQEVQEVLRRASVLGQPFLFDDLLGMGHQQESSLEAALEAAANIGLIQDLGSDKYGFDHALTRQALYAELSSRSRRKLHLAAGEAIEKQPESKRADRAPELAWHFLEAEEQERAMQYSLRAGDAAESIYAHSEAHKHYGMAAELAGDLGDVAQEAEALRKLGAVLTLVGHWEEGRAAFERLASLDAERGDLEGEVTALAGMAQCVETPGDIGRLLERLRAGLNKLPDNSPAARDAHTSLARLYWIAGDMQSAVSEAHAAVDASANSGDDGARWRALRSLGSVLADAGRAADAEASGREMLALAYAIGDLESIAVSHNNLGVSLQMFPGRMNEASREFEAGLVPAQRIGSPRILGTSLYNLGWCNFIAGDWAAAKSRYREGARFTSPAIKGLAAVQVLRLRLLTGDASAVSELEAWDELRDGPREFALVESDLLNDDPVRARGRLLGISSHVHGHYHLRMNAFLADIALRLGDIEEAEELAQSALAGPSGGGDPEDWSYFRRVLGGVRARQGRWIEAEEILTRALEHLGPLRYLRARVLYSLGESYALEGKTNEAREQLQEALDLFQEIGAKRFADQTRRTQDALHR
jgi:class 3 adenylate cyclase/tetratricopeptide (TPR) repeat protein